MAEIKHMYELTYIINSVISDDQIKDLVSRISKFVEENDGELLDVDEWGSRRLAFQIQKKRNGYYVDMVFKAPGEIVPKLERALEIDDNILRYLTLRMDAKMIRHFEASKARRAAEKEEAEAEEASA